MRLATCFALLVASAEAFRAAVPGPRVVITPRASVRLGSPGGEPGKGESAQEPAAGLGLKAVWQATEAFGKVASLVRGAPDAAPDGVALAPASIDEAVARLRADYERDYFISGEVDEALYAEDCEFADPFASFRGRQRFVDNLRNLAGGFITDARIRTLDTSLERDGERPSYTTRLLVKLQLALPWRPVLAWVWGVEHVFDPRTALVVQHIERWEVSPGEGVRQLFRPGPPDGLAQGQAGSAPAAGVKAGQAAAAEGGPPAEPKLDPVLGPAVRLLRRVGALAPEEDGWEGEPTAWAQQESLPQRLSAWTAANLGGLKQAIVERAAGEYDAGAIDARIDREVVADGVVLYSFTGCPFCKRAKEALAEEGARFSAIELDLDEEGAAVRARLGARTGRTSMPSVWIGGKYYGGCNDGSGADAPGLLPLRDAGKLRPLLREVRAVSR